MTTSSLSEGRRAELIDVTAREIAAVGLDGVTMRHVARAAGSTTGTLSHYFVDKRDLLLATFNSRADDARARISAAVDRGSTLLDAVIEAILPLDEERLSVWRVWLAFWGAAVGNIELTKAQQDRYITFRALIMRAIEEGIAAETLVTGLEVTFESQRLAAAIDGIAVQAVFTPEAWPPDLQRRVLELHLAPLRRSPS